MRKIEEQMNNAILQCLEGRKRSWQSGNTSVTRHSHNVSVFLHGNKIAQFNAIRPDFVLVSLFDGGWQTVTTKSRLNAIAQDFGIMGVYQRDFMWYWDNGNTFENDYRQHVTTPVSATIAEAA